MGPMDHNSGVVHGFTVTSWLKDLIGLVDNCVLRGFKISLYLCEFTCSGSERGLASSSPRTSLYRGTMDMGRWRKGMMAAGGALMAWYSG
jgi:hypothetical protein